MQRYRWEHELEVDRSSQFPPGLSGSALSRPQAAPASSSANRTEISERDKSLTSLAQRWITTLPEDARPDFLIAKYARICNRLAMCWADPVLTVALFADDYFADKRGTRQGWPPLALAELKALNRIAISRRDAGRAARS